MATPTFRNLGAMLTYQAGRLGPRPALRFKRHGLYRDRSWDDYHLAARACAAALIRAGIGVGDRVGLLAENRLEWLIADMGILLAGAVNVPPHAPLTARQAAYQFADAGVRWVFVSTREQLAKAVQAASELPDLRGMVAFDALAAPTLPSQVAFQSWDGFLQRGQVALGQLEQELEARSQAVGPASMATIMYTSGTTGNPKGVILTHDNLMSNALSLVALSPHGPDDIVLGWLPLSHIYARTVDHYRCLAEGVTLALAESAETVVQNLSEIQPVRMAGVPRFYEKVLAAVAASDPKETGRRLRGVFGPRVTWLMSGGAPLPVPVARAYLDAGVLLLQGYGLTETSPVITYNRPDHYKLETVGPPIPGVEVKIAADGEVLTRGPHVMPGYWNNPSATRDALVDGWFHTGDLGSVDADGFLTITGRKKELMVLSNGKKVVPTYLEGLLASDPCIEQAVIHGEGRNFLTALIIPHWDNLLAALGKANGASKDQLARDPTVQAFLKRRIDTALADVSPSEQVKKFIVLPQPFSVADEELTVSLKLRRGVVLKKYADMLEALYQE